MTARLWAGRGQGGITVIEMTVVIALLGLVLAMALQGLTAYQRAAAATSATDVTFTGLLNTGATAPPNRLRLYVDSAGVLREAVTLPDDPTASPITYTGIPTIRVVGRGLVDTSTLLKFRDSSGNETTSLTTVTSVDISLSVDLPSAAAVPRRCCPAGCSFPTWPRLRRSEHAQAQRPAGRGHDHGHDGRGRPHPAHGGQRHLRHPGHAAVPARPGLERRPGPRPGRRRRLPVPAPAGRRVRQVLGHQPAHPGERGLHRLAEHPQGGQPGPVPLQRHQPGQPGHHPGALDRPGAGVQRTVRANLRRKGFLDYLYLTDYESLDPQSGYYSDPATATSRCSEYWWQGRSTSYCVRISFVTGDTINGPLHTNDTISVNGNPRFNGKATTEYTGTMSCTASPSFTWRWYGLNGCSDRLVFQSGDPEAVPHLALPTTNTAIKAETDRTAGKTGCLSNGPTRIVLNATGTMTVTSPFTTSSAYASWVGTNIAVPTNGVIYVQNVPSTQTATCTGSQNRLGYPISGDVTDYGCRDGDVFLSGSLKGRLTIAAGNNLSDSRNPTSTFTNPQIHAAMLALGHSVIVQNYDEGAQLGTITINGVIAQKWRGPVVTSRGTGYLKGYGYDSRLQYASPPYVQDITETPHRTSQFAEIQNPTGLPA